MGSRRRSNRRSRGTCSSWRSCPSALVAVGGLIGGAFGGLGVAINTGVLRLQMGAPAKVLAMLGVTVLSAALFVVAAIAFRNAIAPVQTLDVGMCVNGVTEGSVITRIDPVSCSTPHDNEVVGTATYPESSAYPGQATLETFAAPACIAAFNTYVGRDFSSSSLDMLPILPTDATWASGDRAITCVVLARDRSKLTSSVKDAGL